MRFSLPSRRTIRLGLTLGAILAGSVAAANLWVLHCARSRIAENVAVVPQTDVAIVLGTAPVVRHGAKNPFFEHRMDAAALLYTAGKARHFLLTGDNSRRNYDEPTAMRAALISRGVPASAITLDYAGFRTLDSMARAATVFGQRRAIVVTDDFHLARALFLADAYGIEAVGFRSEHVSSAWSVKANVREVASRFVACLDVYVLKTKPRYGGKKETISV